MELLTKIEEALDEIRPYLQNDGGDIELVSFEKGIVTIKWRGYCASCNKNIMTLAGITEAIKGLVPEIIEVVEIN